jgi:hypothetical protein
VTLSVHKPRILVDFDATVHDYSGGWKGHGVIVGSPMPGVFAWLNSLRPYFTVCIYSTRAEQVAGMLAIKRFFREHWPVDQLGPVFDAAGEPFFEVSATKLPALVAIDDRVVRYDGAEYPSAEECLAFRSWYEDSGRADVEGDEQRMYLAGRAKQFREAALSYRRIAREALFLKPSWCARLYEMARTVERIAREIDAALAAPAP